MSANYVPWYKHHNGAEVQQCSCSNRFGLRRIANNPYDSFFHCLGNIALSSTGFGHHNGANEYQNSSLHNKEKYLNPNLTYVKISKDIQCASDTKSSKQKHTQNSNFNLEMAQSLQATVCENNNELSHSEFIKTSNDSEKFTNKSNMETNLVTKESSGLLNTTSTHKFYADSETTRIKENEKKSVLQNKKNRKENRNKDVNDIVENFKSYNIKKNKRYTTRKVNMSINTVPSNQKNVKNVHDDSKVHKDLNNLEPAIPETDVSFLDDIDIDVIVEALSKCENKATLKADIEASSTKHSQIRKVNSTYKITIGDKKIANRNADTSISIKKHNVIQKSNNNSENHSDKPVTSASIPLNINKKLNSKTVNNGLPKLRHSKNDSKNADRANKIKSQKPEIPRLANNLNSSLCNNSQMRDMEQNMDSNLQNQTLKSIKLGPSTLSKTPSRKLDILTNKADPYKFSDENDNISKKNSTKSYSSNISKAQNENNITAVIVSGQIYGNENKSLPCKVLKRKIEHENEASIKVHMKKIHTKASDKNNETGLINVNDASNKQFQTALQVRSISTEVPNNGYSNMKRAILIQPLRQKSRKRIGSTESTFKSTISNKRIKESNTTVSSKNKTYTAKCKQTKLHQSIRKYIAANYNKKSRKSTFFRFVPKHAPYTSIEEGENSSSTSPDKTTQQNKADVTIMGEKIKDMPETSDYMEKIIEYLKLVDGDDSSIDGNKLKNIKTDCKPAESSRSKLIYTNNKELNSINLKIDDSTKLKNKICGTTAKRFNDKLITKIDHIIEPSNKVKSGNVIETTPTPVLNNHKHSELLAYNNDTVSNTSECFTIKSIINKNNDDTVSNTSERFTIKINKNNDRKVIVTPTKNTLCQKPTPEHLEYIKKKKIAKFIHNTKNTTTDSSGIALNKEKPSEHSKLGNNMKDIENLGVSGVITNHNEFNSKTKYENKKTNVGEKYQINNEENSDVYFPDNKSSKISFKTEKFTSVINTTLSQKNKRTEPKTPQNKNEEIGNVLKSPNNKLINTHDNTSNRSKPINDDKNEFKENVYNMYKLSNDNNAIMCIDDKSNSIKPINQEENLRQDNFKNSQPSDSNSLNQTQGVLITSDSPILNSLVNVDDNKRVIVLNKIVQSSIFSKSPKAGETKKLLIKTIDGKNNESVDSTTIELDQKKELKRGVGNLNYINKPISSNDDLGKKYTNHKLDNIEANNNNSNSVNRTITTSENFYNKKTSNKCNTTEANKNNSNFINESITSSKNLCKQYTNHKLNNYDENNITSNKPDTNIDNLCQDTINKSKSNETTIDTINKSNDLCNKDNNTKLKYTETNNENSSYNNKLNKPITCSYTSWEKDIDNIETNNNNSNSNQLFTSSETLCKRDTKNQNIKEIHHCNSISNDKRTISSDTLSGKDTINKLNNIVTNNVNSNLIKNPIASSDNIYKTDTNNERNYMEANNNSNSIDKPIASSDNLCKKSSKNEHPKNETKNNITVNITSDQFLANRESKSEHSESAKKDDMTNGSKFSSIEPIDLKDIPSDSDKSKADDIKDNCITSNTCLESIKISRENAIIQDNFKTPQLSTKNINIISNTSGISIIQSNLSTDDNSLADLNPNQQKDSKHQNRANVETFAKSILYTDNHFKAKETKLIHKKTVLRKQNDNSFAKSVNRTNTTKYFNKEHVCAVTNKNPISYLNGGVKSNDCCSSGKGLRKQEISDECDTYEATQKTFTNQAMLLTVLDDSMLVYFSKQLYTSTDLICEGSFSNIVKCRDNSGHHNVVKIFKKGYLPAVYRRLKEIQNSIPETNFYCISFGHDFKTERYWSVMMEYYPKNLQEMLDKNEKCFFIDIVQNLSKQLMTACVMLRCNNIIHSDINPRHILLNTENNKLKLCGFDRSILYTQFKHSNIWKPFHGSLQYRAPEIILGISEKTNWGYSVDVWAVACIIYEMVTNCTLFFGNTNNDILFKQLSLIGDLSQKTIKKAAYGEYYFSNEKFLCRSLEAAEATPTVIKKQPHEISISVMNAYHKSWAKERNIDQRTTDIEKLKQCNNLLSKMLTMEQKNRTSIEFAMAHPFIYKY